MSIFGPTSGSSADHVQSMCDNKEMPHLETRWDIFHSRQSILINLYPHLSTLSRAYVDLVQTWGWKSFTVLYESEEGLARIGALLKMYDNKGYAVLVRQLDEKNSGDYRYFIYKNSTIYEMLCLILNCYP